MKYTLRQLEVFLATAHFENISRAAENLSMSQSAASASLKELENQFSIQLFDRVGKRLQLNDFGRKLRPKAESLLEQSRELERELSAHDTPGDLKVGATMTIGNYLGVELINQYIRDSPEARVTLEVANTDTIAHEILNFDIDVGLIEGEFHHPDLEIIRWREDKLVCFCSPTHPLAQEKQLSEALLCSSPWILREQGSGTRQGFERAMSGLLPQMDIMLELQHTEAIKRAVEKGLGLSCLSEIALVDAFERGTLVPLDGLQRDFSRTFYFIIHKQKYRSAGIEKWMQICGLTPATKTEA